MKSIFGLIGLLFVLAIVSLLMKTQLKSTTSAVTPAASSTSLAITPTQGATPVQQSQQIQLQAKDMANAALQTPRAVEDEKLNTEGK
jgi:hypothetical protein